MARSQDHPSCEADSAGERQPRAGDLKSILNKAVEWGKLLESPARGVKLLKVSNRRTRILTDEEQAAIVEACPGKLKSIATLALVTRARIGELLALRWEHCEDGYLTFLRDQERPDEARIPINPAIEAVLAAQPRVYAWVFTNSRTEKPFQSVRQVFERAVARAGTTTGDVTLHTLRDTALRRMIAAGYDDSP